MTVVYIVQILLLLVYAFSVQVSVYVRCWLDAGRLR